VALAEPVLEYEFEGESEYEGFLLRHTGFGSEIE
jgi:hypothetical protein